MIIYSIYSRELLNFSKQHYINKILIKIFFILKVF